jgi:hypothetical protein
MHLATTAIEIALLRDVNEREHHTENVAVHLPTHIALASVIDLHDDDLDLLFLTVGEIARRREMCKTGDQERELDLLQERELHLEQEHPQELDRQLGLEPHPELDPRSEQGLQPEPDLLPEPDLQPESDLQPELDLQLEPDLQLELDLQPEPDLQLELGLRLELGPLHEREHPRGDTRRDVRKIGGIGRGQDLRGEMTTIVEIQGQYLIYSALTSPIYFHLYSFIS